LPYSQTNAVSKPHPSPLDALHLDAPLKDRPPLNHFAEWQVKLIVTCREEDVGSYGQASMGRRVQGGPR